MSGAHDSSVSVYPITSLSVYSYGAEVIRPALCLLHSARTYYSQREERSLRTDPRRLGKEGAQITRCNAITL